MADRDDAGGSGLTEAQERRLRRQLKDEADATLFRGLTLDARLQERIRERAGLPRPAASRPAPRRRVPWIGWAALTAGAAAVVVFAVSLRGPWLGMGRLAGPTMQLSFAEDKPAETAMEAAMEAAPPAMDAAPAAASAGAAADAGAARESDAASPKREAASPKRMAPDGGTLTGSVTMAGAAADFDPDQAVALRVALVNETDRPLLLGPAAPTLRVLPAGAGGESRDLPVNVLAGRRLAPGESAEVEVLVPAGLAPGWHSAILDGVELANGGRMTFGAQSRLFFIRFPPGGVRLGTLAPGKSATRDGVTLEVEEVSFTERETRLAFRIPGAAAPAGFDLSLVVDGTLYADLDLGYRGVGGDIRGEAVFGPVPAAARSLAVEMSGFTGQVSGRMVDAAGPWRVSILEEGEKAR